LISAALASTAAVLAAPFRVLHPQLWAIRHTPSHKSNMCILCMPQFTHF
jgi:hypothetical protein